MVTAAGRSYFADVIAAGVRVFEYTPGMLHAKTLVVDDAFAAVGTANMDNRSFRLNYEVTAVSYDAEGAEALAAMFARDLEKSREVDRGGLGNEKLGARLAQAGARCLFAPLLCRTSEASGGPPRDPAGREREPQSPDFSRHTVKEREPPDRTVGERHGAGRERERA